MLHSLDHLPNKRYAFGVVADWNLQDVLAFGSVRLSLLVGIFYDPWPLNGGRGVVRLI